MTSAAVGFQCPECVQEGRKSVREGRTVFGGKVHKNQGLVTTILVVTCVVIWIFQIAVPSLTGRFDVYGLAIASGQWYRLLTAGFLHLSTLHILFNMWALWVLGRPLEEMLGRIRFTSLYFTSLLAGTTASYLFLDPQNSSAGASGAIFGLAAGLIVVARRMDWNLSWLVGIVVLNFLLAFIDTGIDWHAHIGGFVAGLIVTSVFVYTPQPQRVVASVLVVAVVVAVCVGLVSHRTQEIRNIPSNAVVFQLGGSFPAGRDFRPFP
jgi:membrane associated rhomboid family serine protease